MLHRNAFVSSAIAPRTSRLLITCSLLVLLLRATALDLASHCRQGHPANECPCSARPEMARSFCLAAASPNLCVQQACPTRYVCDCNGDTLCRRLPVRTTLSCQTGLSVDAQCACNRVSIHTTAGSDPQSVLVPLRRLAPLARPPASLCSEPPAFWAGTHGQRILTKHWDTARGDGAVLAVGHMGQSASFRSPAAVSNAAVAGHRPLAPLVDSLRGLMEECVAAVLSTRLSAAGVPTQLGGDSPIAVSTDRLVFRPCAYLPREHPVVGMSVMHFFDRAGLLDGALPSDDTALSRTDVVQACKAINRNFERCEIDVGCLDVAAV